MARVKPYFESKFLLTAAQIVEMQNLLAKLTVADSHGFQGNYEVLSIYYDTPDLEFFNDKIHGEFCKTKIRIRFYRNFTENFWHDPCLEIKQRNGQLVKKVRVKLNFDRSELVEPYIRWPDARALMLNNSVDSKFLSCLGGKILNPVVAVYYKRRAMQFKGVQGLRFTFDADLAGVSVSQPILSQEFDFATPARFQRIGRVFEIKSYNPAPDSVLSQLERMKAGQQSFSKYACALKLLLEKRQDSRLII
ncbi:MAG: hypothetical protein PWR01_1931 [Clostridiales bacterium]|jgi:hypothetical protein|nr:hypothetical protein [Clostridiales bacterium]MDN5280858.1 hypothetical protein [Candidatus Ozemobacter sp.]